jgi:hypothetical protein
LLLVGAGDPWRWLFAGKERSIGCHLAILAHVALALIYTTPR